MADIYFVNAGYARPKTRFAHLATVSPGIIDPGERMNGGPVNGADNNIDLDHWDDAYRTYLGDDWVQDPDNSYSHVRNGNKKVIDTDDNLLTRIARRFKVVFGR